jgi:hypothetical protein
VNSGWRGIQSIKRWVIIEEPFSQLQGIFDRKDLSSNFDIRSLTPQQAAGNALAVAVQMTG